MKSQRSTRAKNPQRLSDAIIAKRYLELQRLRHEVREAEINNGRAISKRSKRSALH
jgi:hypothetical protein